MLMCNQFIQLAQIKSLEEKQPVHTLAENTDLVLIKYFYKM